jgi:hypothetical protein
VVSALLLQRRLSMRRSETAFMMLHKLRRAMVNSVREPLKSEIEVDALGWLTRPRSHAQGYAWLYHKRSSDVGSSAVAPH